MKKKSQQEEKVYSITESKLNAVLGRLQMLQLTAQVHVTIQAAFDELKKE